MKTLPPKTIHLMYWYHAKDTIWQEALEAHLKPFQNFISTWYPGKVLPGTDWQREFSNTFTGADIVLLLVSADFLSDNLNNERIQQAIERHQRGEAQVVPIILRPVNWEDTILQSLDVLPPQGKPVVTWGDRNDVLKDDVLKEVAATLRDRAKKMLRQKQELYWVHEGDVLLGAGEYDQALQSYEQVVALDSETRSGLQVDFGFDIIEIYRKRAELLLLLKKYKRAWNAYGQLFTRAKELSSSPGLTSADHIHLAEACRCAGYPEAAELAYNEALRLAPENADIYYRLAHLLFYECRKAQEAIAAYDQAIRLAPDTVQCYIEKGHALGDLRRYKEALKAYDAILQLDARNVVAWMNKGLIFFELKQYENALQAYQKAIFLDPTNAMAFYNMASILEHLNKHSEKSQAFDRATQLGYSGHFNLASSASMMVIEPPTPPLLPWPIATLKSGVPDAATCSHGHMNPFGSVWCELCEELLTTRFGAPGEKEVKVPPPRRTGGFAPATRLTRPPEN